MTRSPFSTPCDFSTLVDLLSGRDNLGDDGISAGNEPGNQMAGVDLRWSRTDHAIDLLHGAYQRDPDGLLAPEVLYHWGIATYLKTRSNRDLYGVWDVLRERFPDSIWTARIP